MIPSNTTTLVELFNALLPGFVAAGIFYSLTARASANSLDRIILALIFTFTVQILVLLFIRILPDTPDDYVLLGQFIAAIALGLVVAIFYNRDFPHRLLRFCKITNENSFPSEWYSAFVSNRESYVALELHDGRIVFGWPTEWPSNPIKGHFRLDEAIWLKYPDDESDSVEKSENDLDIDRDECVKSEITLLIPVDEVMIVEFVSDSNANQI